MGEELPGPQDVLFPTYGVGEMMGRKEKAAFSV